MEFASGEVPWHENVGQKLEQSDARVGEILTSTMTRPAEVYGEGFAWLARVGGAAVMRLCLSVREGDEEGKERERRSSRA